MLELVNLPVNLLVIERVVPSNRSVSLHCAAELH